MSMIQKSNILSIIGISFSGYIVQAAWEVQALWFVAKGVLIIQMGFIVKLSTESYNSIQMDYDALANILPLTPANWNEHHVARWLQFVHLEPLIASFTKHRLNGSQLLALTPQHLHQLGVSNSIIQRKLMRWIREGFAEFDAHLMLVNDNKENVPPNQNMMPHFGKDLQMQRKHTTERQVKAARRPISMQNEEEGMVVRSCDGNLAAFYIMKQRTLKIGRANTNTVRSLEVSVENEHAEIMRVNNKYYLRDNGTQAGTFIKIESPKVLTQGALVEMGSFLLQVRSADLQQRLLQILVMHMGTKQTGQLFITLQDGCNSFNFGRRKTNNFAFDDEHLSGLHARIFLLHGQFVIEDLHSTNGTWLRLSKPFEPSGSFLLENGCTFKVGTTITYTCECRSAQERTRMEEEYDDTCVSCGKQKRDVLLLPCRHNLLCLGCSSHLEMCPMCHSQIHQKIKIYV